MTLATFDKRPADRMDYDIDFVDWLEDGDQITALSPPVLSGSDTASIDGTAFTASRVKIWVIAGAEGESITVTFSITTLQARTKEECFRLRIKGC